MTLKKPFPDKNKGNNSNNNDNNSNNINLILPLCVLRYSYVISNNFIEAALVRM